jgi:hypothetical protein
MNAQGIEPEGGREPLPHAKEATMCHDYAGWFRKARKVETDKEPTMADDVVKAPPQPVPPLNTRETPTHADEREKLPV